MRISELLVEARRKDLKYETILKGPKAKQEIDKVLVKLEGKSSEVFTKLAKKYKELKAAVEDAETKLAVNKGELRDKMEELFDDADEVLTRVVETNSLTLQLAKAVQPSEKPETDYEAAYKAVLEGIEKLVPDLTAQLDAIAQCAIKANTKTKSVPGKASAFTVKEGMMDDIGAVIKALRIRLAKWFASFDKKVKVVRADMDKLQAMQARIDRKLNKSTKVAA